MKKITFLVIGLFMLVGLAQPAFAATRLGGVDVQGACDYQYGRGSRLFISPYNVMGWKCVFSDGKIPPNPLTTRFYGVDLTAQCKRQYKNSRAFASYSNFNNPYSWSCYK